MKKWPRKVENIPAPPFLDFCLLLLEEKSIYRGSIVTDQEFFILRLIGHSEGGEEKSSYSGRG
jgi:hypothetical protein